MSDYKSELNQYIKNTKQLTLPNDITDDRLEFQFENLKDWSVFYTFKDIEKWYQDVIDIKEMTVEEIPVKDCKKWVFGEDKIYHDSGEFFSIKSTKFGRITGATSSDIEIL